MDKNDNNYNNILIKFINKASKFVSYYEELKLIKKNQKIILIFLYNNSMYYDIKTENYRIKEAYKLIKGNKRIKLYIAYFQPYLKLINSYQRVKELKELKEEIEIQKKNQVVLKNEINNLMERENNYIKLINEMNARLKYLEQNQRNYNIKENNLQDNNTKGKKYSYTSCQTKPDSFCGENSQ